VSKKPSLRLAIMHKRKTGLARIWEPLHHRVSLYLATILQPKILPSKIRLVPSDKQLLFAWMPIGLFLTIAGF
jgi:hypothetical protein